MSILGKLACWISKKHKRGKRVTRDGDTSDMGKRYRCPRCGAEWFRK